MESERVVTRYVLTGEEMLQIAEIASKEAVRAYREEQSKEERRRAREGGKIKKTKNMLKSYRRIKATLSEEDEFTEEEKIEYRWRFIQDLMGGPKDSIGKSERAMQDTEKWRQEDMYCVYRIEKAVDMYREECEKSGSEEAKRRCRELQMLYMGDQPYSVQEISEVENVSDKTVYKDIGIACGIVAVYLLGM